MNRDSSVDMSGWGLNPGWGKFFLFITAATSVLGPILPPTQSVSVTFSPRVNRLGMEAAYLPPTGAVVSN
jgi:hypothetical protein